MQVHTLTFAASSVRSFRLCVGVIAGDNLETLTQ